MADNNESENGEDATPREAMTLRDFFAAHALGGLCAHTGTFGQAGAPDGMATRAYEVADAMLEARARS